MARKKGKRIKKVQQALEKRMMLDAAAVFAAVEAIPNAILHLDAQDIDGDNDYSVGDQPADGATVSTWTDGEPANAANNATTGGGGMGAPTYDDNAFGAGRGGIRFDGNDEFIVGNESDINLNGSWPEKSFAFTFRTDTDINTFQVIYEQGGGTRGFQVAVADGNLYVSGYNDTGSEWGADRFKVMNHGAIATNTTYNVIMVFDVNEGTSGTIKSNVNGGNFIALESIGAQANHSANIGVGGINGSSLDPRDLSFPSNGANFDGWIGEIWQWNHALTSQEISDLETYQALKWTTRPSLEFNTGGTVLEGGTFNITNTNLNALDNNTANTALTYQVTATQNGVVQLSGVTVGLGGTFTQDDIDNNRVTFVHDDTNTVAASFNFRLTDGGWLVTDSFNLNVTAVDDPGDDPPVVSTNVEGYVLAGGSTTITSAFLETTDVDTAAASIVYTVTATTDGSVYNTNLAMVVTSFTQADINNGYIDFQQDGTASIPASFDFDVTDGTTIVSDTFFLDVNLIDTAANDPPVIRNNTGDTLAASAEINILTSNLQVVDPDNSISQLVYTITSLDSGNVRKGGVSLTVGQTFRQADIDFGIISFLHDGSAGATAGFGFDVTDGNSTISGYYTLGVVSNTAPTIAGFGPFSIAENAADGLLIATASGFDVDGDGLTYSIQSGNASGIFQINPINGQITIADNTNLNYEVTNSYSLVIRVTDDGAGSLFNQTTVVINVTDVNDAPVIPVSGPFSIGEFAADTDAVGTVTAADEDVPADTITYSISGGTGAALFNIDNSGNITVNGNGNFDFEVGPNSYTLDIVANDGALNSNTQTITINITDVNDVPVLPASGPFSIGEHSANTAAVGTVNAATDTDVPADTITYSISGGTGAALFNIDNSGNITVNGNGNFDFEGGTTSYTLDVVANDGGANSNTITVTVNITDENDAPVLPASGPFSIAENAADTDAVGSVNAATDQDVPADTITYSISGGTGAALFNIDNSGNITVNGSGNFDFETTTSYTLDIVANDGASNSNTQTITINITDVNDAPVLPASGPFSIGENSADTDAVGTVTATDADVPADTITYSISGGTGAALFNIDNSGNITVNGNGNFDFEGGTTSYTLDIVANDGSLNSNTQTITINITDENDAPALPASGPFSIGEHSADTDAVGTVTATDVDVPADTITYSISGGTGAALFSIDNSGNITVNGNGNFDFETGPNSYTLDILANDGNANSNTITVTVNITDQNDAPTLIVTNPADILEGGVAVIDGAVLAGADADDVDGDITYTASNLLNGQLELTGAPGVAVLSFTQADVAAGDVIFVHDGSDTLVGSFDLSLADGGEDGAGAALGSVSIGITPVNDPVVITTNVEVSIPVGTALTLDNTILEGTDPDDGPSEITYTASNIMNGTLTVNGVAALTFTQADINAGLVVFTHDGTMTLTGSFDISLADGGENGVLPDVALFTVDILFPPTVDTNTGFTVLEGTPDNPSINLITTAELSASDFDTATTDLLFNVLTSPINGQLELTTAPGVAITSFSQDDLDNNRLVYVHDGSETIADSFEFEVTDGYFTLPADTYSIIITPQNDKPEITTNVAPSIAVGDSITFDNTFLEGTDPDDAPSDITYTASNVTNGTLTVNGVVALTFTQADVNAGLVVFTHDGTMTVTGSFDVSLADGGEDGATPDLGTVIVNIEFLPVLDVNAGFTVLEGTSLAVSITPITVADLSVSDFDTPDTDLVFNIIDFPINGQLELTTAPGVAVMSFTQDDIVNGRIVYVHDGSETIVDSFEFEITDGFYTLPVETFLITITPQNDPPELIRIDNTAFIENMEIGRVFSHWAVSDPDGPAATMSIVGGSGMGLFSISGRGIAIAQMMDYEVDPHSFTLTLRAFDGQYFIDQDVTIYMGDMNEIPVVTQSAEGRVDRITIDTTDIRSFRPIEDTFNGQGSSGYNGGLQLQLLRSVGFAGVDTLGFAFYGSDMAQIIRENVTNEISALSGATAGGDGDELTFEITVQNSDDGELEENTNDDNVEKENSLSSNNILKAILAEQNNADTEDGKEKTSNVYNKEKGMNFVQSTQIQLDDAAIYYKKKLSSLEKALLGKRQE